MGEVGGDPCAPLLVRPRSIFNATFFRTFTLGEPVLEAEIVGLFLAELPVIKGRMVDAIDTADWSGVVHRLRGAALGIGAERLADAAKVAEGLGADDDADRLRSLADMTDEIAALQHELQARGFAAAA